MDLTNLATVFAPNILHCVKPGQTRSEVSVERAEERIDVINVVRALLENSATLFTIPAALLDELYLHMMDTHPADLDLALSRRAEEQCNDEVDPCSEAETFSVDEALGGIISTAQTAKKVWSREQCLHQTAGIGGDIGPKPRRPKRPSNRRKEEGRSNSVDSGSSEDPADPRRKSSPMIITASLTIPMTGAFTLNLDDPDIPFIEEQPKPSVPPRRQRQRSISGCSEGGRHGSDSAVGSSATLSGDQPPSSPPSWASSPPASPDSTVTAVSYIPDQQAVLQRVSFTTSSEVRQISRSVSQEASKAVISPAYTPSITSIGGATFHLNTYINFSYILFYIFIYTSHICIYEKYIKNACGSKTADIERMLHISQDKSSKTSTISTNVTTTTSSTGSDSKKYTKRRYTDSRHQTRHIPDAESLAGKSNSVITSVSSISSSSVGSISNSSSGQQRNSVAAPVWKRREIISSVPSKQRQNFF
ncbi:GSCOCG00002101001-RA-CDS [Cotesia congregata]|nr:GSCOCG00002101001-RA-CDS [Cotesia congregata]